MLSKCEQGKQGGESKSSQSEIILWKFKAVPLSKHAYLRNHIERHWEIIFPMLNLRETVLLNLNKRLIKRAKTLWMKMIITKSIKTISVINFIHYLSVKVVTNFINFIRNIIYYQIKWFNMFVKATSRIINPIIMIFFTMITAFKR